MRVFIIVLVLIFSFQSWTKADDIRDFEIEGMSLGESLLKYDTKEEIIEFKESPYKSKKWSSYVNFFKNSNIYDGYQVHFKTHDPKYIIRSIDGVIVYEDNIEECYKKKEEIVLVLDKMFQDAKKENYKKSHSGDKSGKSKSDITEYEFQSGDLVRVNCINWSKDMKYTDKLKVIISSKEFIDFINNEAY